MSASTAPAGSTVVPPLAARIAASAAALDASTLPASAFEKVRVCLMDLIGCAFESRHLPWSRQAEAIATRTPDGATLIGSPHAVAVGDAAFANAVMGHGLVREDMHPGSISHLGIVVLPALLALAQTRRVTGREFIAATVLGYEVGGRVGRAVMDSRLARIHRPTGVTGPVAAAAAGARLLGLSIEATTNAVALAANTTVGFNQWAHTGGSEMFFHPGFAARDAVTAVRLAELGAFFSPSALDGEAGLFASLGKRDGADGVRLFDGPPEILSVYHKPVPACNFAQTPAQAALRAARESGWALGRIASITVRVPQAGASYPGCDYAGQFAHVLQAKMSIQYNVAAAIAHGRIAEGNFARLDAPDVARLIGVTKLEVDDAMTRAYPGAQGGEVELRDVDGVVHVARLADVVHANAVEVRERFRAAAVGAVGTETALAIEACIDGLADTDDAGALGALLRVAARDLAPAA
jgi:2-methylcitrate dehydratase PrpD